MIDKVNALNAPLEEKLDLILSEVNFNSHLKKLENTQDRIDNIQELKSKLKDIKNLDTFLEDVTLFQGSDEDNSNGKVRCLTLHLAKGLEFPVVFIPGFEDRLLHLKIPNPLKKNDVLLMLELHVARTKSFYSLPTKEHCLVKIGTTTHLTLQKS